MIEITLPVSKYTVQLAESITYGEHIAINQTLLQGIEASARGDQKIPADSALRWTRKKLLTVVKKINDGTKDLAVSDDILDSLPFEDGKMIEAEVEKILATEEKKS